MADLQNKISFDTAGAIANVKSLAAALNKYNSVAKSTTTNAATSFKKSSKDIADTAKYLESATGAGFLGVGAAARNAAKQTKKASGEMILSWKSVIRIFAIQLIHQGISKITSKISEGSKEARDYAKSLAEVQTIGPRFKKDFAGLDQQVKDFSRLTGFSLDKSTSGLYQTLSNQVAVTGDEFNFMGSAAKLAVAGVADLDSAVNLLSSAINSYGKSSAETDDVSGKMFKTVELGRLKIEDIANSYGRVLGLASQLGVPLSEVNASMATLTSTGMDHNEAMTLITNTQLKLIKPTGALKKAFDAIGVVSAEAGVQAYGFQGFLQQISKHGGSSATEMGKLYGRIRAVRGALGLTNQMSERYIENLKQIKAAGAETVEEAKGLIFKTNAKQLELEFNEVSIAVTSFGQTFNTALLTVIQASGGAVAAIKAISAAVVVGIGTFIAYKVVASTAFTTIIAGSIGVKAAFLALATSPVGMAIAAAAAAAAVVVAYSHMSNAAEKAAKKMREASKEASKRMVENTVAGNKKELESWSKLASDLQIGLTDRIKAENEAARETGLLQGVAFGNLTDQMGDSISAVDAYFNAIKSHAKGAAQAVRDIGLAIIGVTASLEDWKFDRQQKKFSDANREVFARTKKAEELSKKARNAEAKGNAKEASHFRKRAQAYAQQAVAVADQTKNASLIARAEDAYEKTAEENIKFLERKEKLTKKIAATAKAETVTADVTLGVLKGVAKQYAKALEITPEMSPKEIAAQEERAITLAKKFNEVIKGRVKFSNIIADVDVSDKIKLRQMFGEITEGVYEPFTAQTVSMEKATVESFKRIGAAYKKYLPGADTREEELGLKGTAKEKSRQLLDFGKQVNKGITEEQNAAILRGQINEKNLKNTQEMVKFNEILQKGDYIGGTIQRGGLAAMMYGEDPKWLAAQENLKNIESAFTAITKAQTEGTTGTEEYIKNIRTLREASVGFEEKGWLAPDPKGLLTGVIKRLQETEAAQRSIKDVTPDIEAKDVIMDRVIKIEAESTVAETVAEAKTALDGLTDKVITVTVQYIKTGNFPEEKGEYFGGIYRAFGGRGHDRIPAMLSRGEFVTSAGATKKMYSQLVADNASYRYLGGPATNSNTTFNNTFNIDGSAAPQQTAREIQKLIKRENRIRK